jgi:hypothetical protein
LLDGRRGGLVAFRRPRYAVGIIPIRIRRFPRSDQK